MVKKYTKFCSVCGGVIDMRKDYHLPEPMKVDVRNPEYHYVHRGECADKVRHQIRIINKLILGSKK